ncbi:MAG TPA: maleylpyruvate isomerase N-terminal domain-containing protein [Chitinophagaceae bacterium]|nr:maleylpyruvate isomerase N-terminal domain-containing protein [Chitinophagaceae bacterium]
MKHPLIIETIDLFPKLDTELIRLLRSLSKEDWERQTLAPLWKVKDIAAHLLDGNLRAISMLKDKYFGEKAGKIETYRELVSFLNGLNADWVKAMHRVSPELIIFLLEITGPLYNDIWEKLDPKGKAIFSVAWAGEEESENWFHIAREYTEKWHHQQQIRYAVGKTEPLYQREFYYPYLDTSMRALPHHYRDTIAVENECIRFTITGDGGGTWFLIRKNDKWQLSYDFEHQPACSVIIEGEIAWRLFTRGISKTEAEKSIQISGKHQLGRQIFYMLAVMA